MSLNWLSKEIAHALTNLNLHLSSPIYKNVAPEIQSLLEKTVLLRGKRLRPTLCFLLGQLFGVEFEKIHPYARAAEFVHAATLAHDDVMDNASWRRGEPSLNIQTSNKKAILSGDFLFARVMRELADLEEVQIIQDLASTIENLVYGEWLQLEAQHNIEITKTQLEKIAEKKTASLMSWCCRIPGHLLKLDTDILDTISAFGNALGIAFQMVDDLMDFSPNLKKSFAQDLQDGLLNFVSLELRTLNPSLIDPMKNLFGKNLNTFQAVDLPWTQEELHTACANVRNCSQIYLENAEQILIHLQTQIPHYTTYSSSQNDAFCALKSILFYLKRRKE